MANEIKIKLTIDGKDAVATLDLSDQKLQKIIGSSKQVKAETAGITRGFERMASVILSYMAFNKITGFLKDSVKAFADEQKTVALLRDTVGDATAGLIEYANQLAKITGIQDDEIYMVEKQIGDFVKDEEMIKKLTKATIDFAVAKRIDLVSASNLVARALAGESKNLGRIKLDIDENARGMDRANQIADAMTKIWGGQAETAGNTFTGVIGRMKNAVDNLKESVGERLAPILTIIAEKISTLSEKGKESKNVLMTIEVIARTLGIVLGGVTQIIITLGSVLGGVFGMIGRIVYELPTLIEGMARAATGDWLGAAQGSAAADRIATSFNEWKNTMSSIQKSYADFYNLMLYPKGKGLPGKTGSGGKVSPLMGFEEKGGKSDWKDWVKAGVDAEKEYYEKVKFEDENYFQWKSEQYIRDYYAAVAAGANRLQQEVLVNKKIQDLIDERSEYERDKLTDPQLRGLTAEKLFEQLQQGVIIRNRHEFDNKEKQRVKELHDDLMDAASDFSTALARGLERGGRKFMNYVAIALQAAVKIYDIIDKMKEGEEAVGALKIISQILGFIPMANGGIINEPVMGIGKSGRGYLLGERGSEAVIPLNQLSEMKLGANINVNVKVDSRTRGTDIEYVARKVTQKRLKYG